MKFLYLTKKRMFRTLLTSYILVLLIPIALSAIMYTNTLSAAKKQVSDMGEFSALQLKTQTDAFISKVISTASSISINPTIRSTINLTEDCTPEERYQINKLSNYLGENESGSETIQNAYIYFGGSRSLLSSRYRYIDNEAEMFAEKSFGVGIADLEELIKKNPKGTVMLKTDEVDVGSESLILVIEPVMNENYLFKGAVILTINAEKLMGISENAIYKNGTTLIISPERDIYVSADGSGKIFWDDSGQTRDASLSKLVGYGVCSAESKSDISGLLYATAIPVDEFYQPVRSIMLFMIRYIIICLAIGVVAAFRAAKKRYSPIENILKHISTKQEGSEFQAIEQALKHATEREKVFERLQIEQQENARNNVLEGMVKGRYSDIEYIGSVLSLHNLDLSGNLFAVAAFDVEDFLSLFFGKEDMPAEEQLKLSYVIFKSVIEELLAPISRSYAVKLDTSFACIICINNATYSDETLHSIKEALNRAMSFIEENFGLQILAAVSPVLNSISELSTGYSYALDAVEYATLTDQSDKCVLYNESLPTPIQEKGEFLKQKRKLLNQLIAGDFREASDTVEDMVKDGMLSADVGIPIMKRRVYLLKYILLETYVSIIDTFEIRGASNVEYEKELSLAKTPEELTEAAKSYLLKIESLTMNECRPEDYLGSKIKTFIDANIDNPELDITFVGDYFDISQSYASRRFKEHAGITILDYINAKRIEKAKEYLTTTQKSIKQISEEVGYRNAGTLSRALRRLEGLSPSAFRDATSK